MPRGPDNAKTLAHLGLIKWQAERMERACSGHLFPRSGIGKVLPYPVEGIWACFHHLSQRFTPVFIHASRIEENRGDFARLADFGQLADLANVPQFVAEILRPLRQERRFERKIIQNCNNL